MLSQYREEIAKDLKIDDFNIKNVQLNLPSKKHFWIGRLIDAKIELQTLKKKKLSKRNTLIDKVIEASPVKIFKADAEHMVDKMDDIVLLSETIKEYEILIEYLEKVEKIFSTMHWEIKNIIQINEQERL